MLDKADLLKTLRAISSYDSGASPYIAVQVQPDKPLLFFRSSNFGSIQSTDLTIPNPSLTYVSLEHFQDCLKVLKESEVQVELDANGTLVVSSIDNTFNSILRVHTVQANQTGLKHHDVGPVKTWIDPTAFLGIDVKPFHAAIPPVLVNGKLMLATHWGVVLWHGPESLKNLTVQPREAILKLVCGNKEIRSIFLTENGYWGADAGNLVTFIYGHLIGKELFNANNVAGVKLADLPADRLVTSLKAVSGLCGDKDKVELDPKRGVVTRDRFGNEATFSLGVVGGWNKITTFGKTAKTIVDALSQSEDEEVSLWSVGSSMRLQRGPFEVNFRTI